MAESKGMMGGDAKISSVVSKISSTLDYRARLQSEPRYELSDIYPQTGNRSLELNRNSEQSTEFELPPRCINLSRSVLEFGLAIDLTNETADQKIGLNGATISLRRDCASLIKRVEVFTRTGVRLMDLTHQQLWGCISNSWFADEKQYEALNNADYTNNQAYRTMKAQPWMVLGSDEAPSENKNTTIQNDAESLIQYGRHVFVDDDRYPENGDDLYYGPGDLARAVINEGKSRSFYKKYYLDLAKFRESILAVDKSLFFGGQVLMVKITWAKWSEWVCAGAASTGDKPVLSSGQEKLVSVTPGVAASKLQVLQESCAAQIGAKRVTTNNGVQTAATATDLSCAIRLEDVSLRCAFETNPVIISQIKSKVMSAGGLKLFFPYVHCFKETRTISGDNQLSSVITRLNRGYGLRLQRIVSTATQNHGGSSAGLFGEHYAIFGIDGLHQVTSENKLTAAKNIIKSYYTTLNNRRLQERDIVVLDGNNRLTPDHYNQHKHLVMGSVANSADDILDKFAHCDVFDAYRADKEDFTNVVAGLPLSDDMQHTINAVVQKIDANTSQTNFYTFAVVQRSLQLKPDSITVV